MERLFFRFTTLYGKKWTEDAHNPGSDDLRKAIWMQALMQLTAVDIQRGIAHLHIGHHTWPPTPLAFRNLCELLIPPPCQQRRLADQTPRYDPAKARAEIQRLKALVYEPKGSHEERIAEYARLRWESERLANISVNAWRKHEETAQ